MENGIKKIREELGWTKQELADYLGVSCRSIYRWEAGDVQPSKLALKQIRQLQDDIISGDVLPTPSETLKNDHRAGFRRLVDIWHFIKSKLGFSRRDKTLK